MIAIHHVAFSPDGDLIEVSYSDLPDDARVGGQVVMMRSLHIDLRHPDYREDAELLVRQATRLVKNALEDWESSEPYVPAEDESEEGLGMGHGPES